MYQVACGIMIIFLSFSTAAAQSLSEGSLWKNTNNSLLLITKIDTSQNTFVGTFVNYHPQFPQCQGVGVPVSGRMDATNLAFVANFAPCSKTITVWKGSIAGSTIKTNYDLRYVDTNFEIQPAAGSDDFTKQ